MKRKLGKRALRNRYFREVLAAITGIKPPTHFQLRKHSQTSEQQDWCSYNSKPHWACGYSVMESAERFVLEAESNGNIISVDDLPFFTTKWEKGWSQ